MTREFRQYLETLPWITGHLDASTFEGFNWAKLGIEKNEAKRLRKMAPGTTGYYYPARRLAI
jgi:hypothetical protein